MFNDHEIIADERFISAKIVYYDVFLMNFQIQMHIFFY